jgi:DNA invertase Pin-like site-specific DNA recombinase
MTLAYIRISTDKQDADNQRHTILDYANQHKIFIDEFVSIQISSRKSVKERLLIDLLSKLNKKDILIVTELSRLGRSVSEVTTMVKELIDKEIRLISIKESIDTQKRHDINTKVIITMFSLLAELERDLISMRTKEGLKARKEKGQKLGRPKGAIGKSKLDSKEDQIKKLLDKGVNISNLSKIFDVSYNTMYNFVRSRKLKMNF